jgi:hypothetical protein
MSRSAHLIHSIANNKLVSRGFFDSGKEKKRKKNKRIGLNISKEILFPAIRFSACHTEKEARA